MVTINIEKFFLRIKSFFNGIPKEAWFWLELFKVH